MKLVLPPGLAAQIESHARDAFPRECCGLIAGIRDGEVWRAHRLYPAPNMAEHADRFLLDPAVHIAAAKAARADGHLLIGCYHSHPGGTPQPSAADLDGAGQEDFLWLIAAFDGTRCQIAAWRYSRGVFTGADWVTSSE